MDNLQRSKASNRIYGLDIYRAIAIILVVHTHGRYMLKDTMLKNFPWIKLMDGVELFFVLSGFLIGGILIKIIVKHDYRLSTKVLFAFWKRRWYRTLPLYYVILLANVGFVYFGLSGGDLSQFNWKFLLFLQNFDTSFHSFFWESWSLSVEEWFYIILPMLLFLMLKIRPNKESLLFIILLLIVLPLAYRITQVDVMLSGDMWDRNVRKVVLMRLDSIIYGVLAAYIKFYYKHIWQSYKLLYFVIGLVAMLLIAYIPRSAGDFWTQTFYLNCTSIAAMLLLPYVDSITHYKSIVGRCITQISKISYSMYLVNLALVSSVISMHATLDNCQVASLWYLMYWLIIIVVSKILYHAVELPFLRLRD